MKHPTPPPKRSVVRESQKEEFIQPRVCCLQKPPFWERWRWRQWREIPKPQWRMRIDGRGLDTQGRRKGQKRKGVLHQKRKRNGNTVLEKNGRWTAVQTPPPKLREWSRFENRELSRDSNIPRRWREFPGQKPLSNESENDNGIPGRFFPCLRNFKKINFCPAHPN